MRRNSSHERLEHSDEKKMDKFRYKSSSAFIASEGTKSKYDITSSKYYDVRERAGGQRRNVSSGPGRLREFLRYGPRVTFDRRHYSQKYVKIRSANLYEGRAMSYSWQKGISEYGKR